MLWVYYSEASFLDPLNITALLTRETRMPYFTTILQNVAYNGAVNHHDSRLHSPEAIPFTVSLLHRPTLELLKTVWIHTPIPGKVTNKGSRRFLPYTMIIRQCFSSGHILFNSVRPTVRWSDGVVQ